MPKSESLAERLLHGDAALASALGAELIAPRRDNFVERPWGGTGMRRFKRLCELPAQLEVTGLGLGEAFEIAAYDADPEAASYPSKVRLTDGSEITLPRLLAMHGETLLGREFVARHGARFPLLPKTLDIHELLSVQGHPEGCTEVYIIIEAEPGATIRVGFATDVDGAAREPPEPGASQFDEPGEIAIPKRASGGGVADLEPAKPVSDGIVGHKRALSYKLTSIPRRGG